MKPKGNGKGVASGGGDAGRVPEDVPYSHMFFSDEVQQPAQWQDNRQQFFGISQNGMPNHFHPAAHGAPQQQHMQMERQNSNARGRNDGANNQVQSPQKRQRTSEAAHDTVASPQVPSSGGGLDAGSLKQYFSLPLEEVAKKMGVSASAIER